LVKLGRAKKGEKKLDQLKKGELSLRTGGKPAKNTEKKKRTVWGKPT